MEKRPRLIIQVPRGGAVDRQFAKRAPAQIAPRTLPVGALPVALDQAWYDTIFKATERVAALVPGTLGDDPRAGSPLAWTAAYVILLRVAATPATPSIPTSAIIAHSGSVGTPAAMLME